MINEHALITGASSGIGLEISKCLAVRGYSLILVSRRKQKLDEIRNDLTNQFKVKVDIIAADLEDMKTPELIYNYCKGKGYFVHLLVNNAGYALPKPFHETPMEDEEKFLRVLGISVIALTKLFIKDMIKETIKNGVCEVANDNANGQVIISGDKEAVNSFQIFLEKKKN